MKEHIAQHGAGADNDSRGILGGLHSTWISIKGALTGKDNNSLIETIITGEKAVIGKYDELIADFADHADHMNLLKSQRENIKSVLAGIEMAESDLHFRRRVKHKI